MKRGKALIIALVLLLVVSVFSTGNYIPFADNLSGGAYSTVGNAIAIVTGNAVGFTGNVVSITGNAVAPQIIPSNMLGKPCEKHYECGSGSCVSGKCAYKGIVMQAAQISLANGQRCTADNLCASNFCNNANPRVCAPKITTPGIAMQAMPVNVPTCTSWKNCNANQYCQQNGACAVDNRQIIFPHVDRECAGDYQTKIGKGEICKTSMVFSLGNDANKQWFLRSGCTANSQCQLTISGQEIYNYCRKDGFCDARLLADGRGCNTKPNNCAIDESCDTATNKCVRVYPDTGGGEAYDSNTPRLKLKSAIENALNMLRTRLAVIEAQHQTQATGDVTVPVMKAIGRPCTASSQCISHYCNNANPKVCAVVPAGGFPDGGSDEAYTGPKTLSEWKTALTSLSTAMQAVEDRICAESFKHLEIETEGLPCSSTSPLLANANLPTARSSILSTLFRRAVP